MDDRPNQARKGQLRPLHPFLFAAYPVLFLLAHNVSQVSVTDALVPLALVLGAAGVLLASGRVLFRDALRPGIVVTAGMLLFLSYGQVLEAVREKTVAGAPLDREPLLFAAAALVLALVAVMAFRPRARLVRVTRTLNVVSAALVVLQVVTIAGFHLGERPARQAAGPAADLQLGAATADGARDIYFIVPDRYPSERVLRTYYDFDNSDFIGGLRDRGFYVADDATANYPKTPHSLGAALNLGYLDHLPEDSGDWNLVYDLLRGSEAARFLVDRGYTYVFIGSRYHALTEDPDAHVNIRYDPFSEFSRIFAESTMLWPLATSIGLDELDPRKVEYRRTLFQFDRAAEVPELEGPTFTFMHLFVPHNPFIFDADGSYVPEEVDRPRTFADSFIRMVRFGNTKLLELVDELLSGPEEDHPIILIQSDEGPGPAFWRSARPGKYDWTQARMPTLEKKFGILSAYYLPGSDGGMMYPEITPVNLFRVLFDEYFGTSLGRLEDRNHIFPNELEPYRFIDITDVLARREPLRDAVERRLGPRADPGDG